MLVLLGYGVGDLRDLVLLITVHNTEVPGSGEIITTVTAAFGKPVTALVGVIGPRQGRPRPRCLSGGAGLPGSSSLDGGFEEFPEFRDSRCSSLASFPDKTSFAST